MSKGKTKITHEDMDNSTENQDLENEARKESSSVEISINIPDEIKKNFDDMSSKLSSILERRLLDNEKKVNSSVADIDDKLNSSFLGLTKNFIDTVQQKQEELAKKQNAWFENIESALSKQISETINCAIEAKIDKMQSGVLHSWDMQLDELIEKTDDEDYKNMLNGLKKSCAALLKNNVIPYLDSLCSMWTETKMAKSKQNEAEEAMRIAEENQRETKSRNNLLEKEIDGLKDKLSDSRDKIGSLERERENLDSKLHETINDCSQLRNQLSSAESSNSKLAENLQKSSEHIDQLKDSLEKTSAERDDFIEKSNNLSTRLNSSNAECDNLKHQLEIERKNVADTSEKLRSSEDKYKLANDEFKEAMKPYMGIYELMCKCDSLKDCIKSLGLTGNKNLSISEQILLANAFGKEFTFARVIYRGMKTYKESNKVPLDTNELNLIRALNDLYKGMYGEKLQEIDALDCLGMDKVQKMDFDRDLMRDINDPRNTDLGDVKKIYVPALRMFNGNERPEERALVSE